jgi:hypothetical protein
MFGKSISRHAYSLDKRDAKMAACRGLLNRARISRNHVEITRLTRELKLLGQSIC